MLIRVRRFAVAAAVCVLTLLPAHARAFTPAVPLATRANPVVLSIDASQANRGILFVQERIPVSGPTFTLEYPKWIPGEHGPSGPLNNLAALRVSANGKALTWRRDRIDMWGFHVSVPAGVRAVDVAFDVLMNAPGDVMSTSNVALLNWNRALLYQNGIDSHHYFVRPSITLPNGWHYGTALHGARSGNRIAFPTTPLNMLVDSPLDMGAYVKKWTLFKNAQTYVEMDGFADAPQDLDIPKKLLAAYKRVPAEAFALYGSRHFANYHALLTLSDAIGFQGIEHHQSSDNRAPADFLTKPAVSLAAGDLITHEFSHSWNGKYRRPYDLTTPNFQVPQQTDLLWVYEGMNQYLGDMLSFRAGIRAPKTYPEYLASIYADMDTETGRDTTPLIDLTTGAPYYYLTGSGAYHAIRRGAGDFYTEGELVWLDVDTIIRQRSHGARSLDTFLHRFTAPAVTGPIVDTYTRAQIESLLNSVQPYDWHAFFQKWVYDIAIHPPTDELARSGWKLIYNHKPNKFMQASSAIRHGAINAWYSVGLSIAKGNVTDVRYGSPAWQAGFGVGMHVDAIDGQKFSDAVLRYELGQAQHSGAAMNVVVDQSGWFRTLALNYHGGALYPHLERIKGTPDMLAEIMRPHAK